MKTRKVIDHITNWLTDYAEQAGTRGWVMGISGGIDSAVTSTLAAMTKRPLLCVEMPIHQDPVQVSRARAHIQELESRFENVSSVEVDLTAAFDALVAAFVSFHGTGDGARELALANTRARLRMTTLYYLAALEKSLVVGTGNKVEDFGIGFFTKYGDGGVDLSPIADLTKTEVSLLGEALEIGAAIREAPPTDGLWGDRRTDEDQLGASYPELEWAMAFDAGGGNEDGLEPRQREVLAIYRRRHAANRHKIDPIPVCKIPDALRS